MLTHIALAFCASLLLSASADAAEPIKIGVVSTLTGPYAEWGTFQVNGLQLALDDIKKELGEATPPPGANPNFSSFTEVVYKELTHSKS